MIWVEILTSRKTNSAERKKEKKQGLIFLNGAVGIVKDKRVQRGMGFST